MKVLYETVCTDSYIKSPNFICLDDVDINKIDKRETYHCFVSLETKRKLLENKIKISVEDNPNQFTSQFLLSHFRDMMLSTDMVLVPFGAIFNGLNIEDTEVFLRPNSGYKVFPGQVVSLKEIGLFNSTYKIQNDILCARSSVVDIVSEKRTFLSIPNRKIITESLYSHDKNKQSIDFSVEEIVNELFSKIEVDLLPDVIVADFALAYDGGVRLIEFNSATTSGLYQCNIGKIISEIESLGRWKCLKEF